MRYTDGTGGCDGCLNWAGVGNPAPSPFKEEDFYAFPPVNNTDNNGLGDIVEKLELIYTTIDWPFQVWPRLFLLEEFCIDKICSEAAAYYIFHHQLHNLLL